MKNEEEIRKALGKKSRNLKTYNMITVFLEIAKEPSSFSELLKKTALSRPVLTDHLQFLEKNLAIYREIIKQTQTLNPKEVGKVVYRVSIDEIPRMIEQALSILSILSEPFEDKKLNKELEEYKQGISKLLTRYIEKLNTNREQAKKLEIENLKKEQLIEGKKRES